MDLGLKNKTVLVLASSKGLGRAVAHAYASEGAKVMISSRKQEDLQQTAATITQETGQEVSYYAADVCKQEDIHSLVRHTADHFGTVDVLINNAGGPPSGSFEDFDDQAWYDAFELNLLSYIRSIREVLPYMKKQKAGRIVNIASSSIKEPIDGLVLSNTLRNGVAGLAKSLATELAPLHILINTVGPGQIKTDRLNALDQKKADLKDVSLEEIQRLNADKVPLGRYGSPAEFAHTIMYLGSFTNTYVTGQSILVDGGFVKAL